MSISDCITAYTSLSGRMFSKKRTWRYWKMRKSSEIFDSDRLEQALQEVIEERQLEIDARLRNDSEDRCKV